MPRFFIHGDLITSLSSLGHTVSLLTLDMSSAGEIKWLVVEKETTTGVEN